MSEHKTEIASDTYKTANAALALENAQVKTANATLTQENEALRTQLEQANTIIENDLKAELAVRILSASEYKEEDLMNLSPSQLQTIEETLTKSKGYASTQPNLYKSIRAGNASQKTSRLTVGNLYGKTREELMKIGGEM